MLNTIALPLKTDIDLNYQRMIEIVLKTAEHFDKHLELTYEQEAELSIQAKELGLKIRKDENEEEDRRELYLLLNHYLSYPSTQDAEIHRQANRLGKLDVNQELRYKQISCRVLLVLPSPLKETNHLPPSPPSHTSAVAAGSSCRRSSYLCAVTHCRT